MVLFSGQISYVFLCVIQFWMVWLSGYIKIIIDIIMYKEVNVNCKIKRII